MGIFQIISEEREKKKEEEERIKRIEALKLQYKQEIAILNETINNYSSILHKLEALKGDLISTESNLDSVYEKIIIGIKTDSMTDFYEQIKESTNKMKKYIAFVDGLVSSVQSEIKIKELELKEKESLLIRL